MSVNALLDLLKELKKRDNARPAGQFIAFLQCV